MRYYGLALLVYSVASSLLPVKAASASQVFSLTGTVTQVVSSGEFVFQTGFPHGHTAVFYSASMVVPSGWQIGVGKNLTATGTFNSRGQLLATRVTPPYHIATWVYDDNNYEGETASASSVKQLVTYALGNAKALNDCHVGTRACLAVFYFNPNHLWDNAPASCTFHPDADVLAASSENWFVHDTGYTDAAHRVYGKSKSGCTIFEMNPLATGSQAWWRTYVRTNADAYDAYQLDNDPMDVTLSGYFPLSGGCSPWPSLCYSTQEIPNNAAEVQARASFVNAMSHSNGNPMYFFFQQASFNIPLDVSAFTATSRFLGLSCEGCIATYAIPVRPKLYASVLSEMAAVTAKSRAYLLISHGTFASGSASQILQRLVTTGIVWLAYSEGHIVVQPDLENNTRNLAVWPEDLLYPSLPLQSMVAGSNDLQVAPGVYRREFAECYQRAVPIGPCAAIVNANGSAVSIQAAWLKQKYGHVVTLIGGDVFSGGAANITSVSFVPNVTSVQASGALLLAR